MIKITKFIFNVNRIVLIFSLVISFSAKAKHVFKSSEQQVQLLELYSTQSCSSCPPAQRWVSSLKNNKNLWKSFIPVVFHVDYWDHLGWKDPYSSKAFSSRQRKYAAQLYTVPYTPMFVIAGKERSDRSLKYLQTFGEKVGILEATEEKPGEYKVKFSPKLKTHSSLIINYAILGSGIKTKVTAGENEGEMLKHDFLILSSGEKKLQKTIEGYTTFVATNLNQHTKIPEKSIVFWVSQDNNLKPIQAIGGPLKEK